MTQEWTRERLKELIDLEAEETLSREHKAAGALAKSDSKKTEITKDVSAFANSAGGRIFYGIAEHQERERSHLPERIDPITDPKITKEWLEDVLTSSIQPKIDGLVIHPVRLDEGTVYVIDVPASMTAHQAKDHKYYKRRNTKAEPMEHYEVLDVMNRRQGASLRLMLVMVRNKVPYREGLPQPHHLHVGFYNDGRVKIEHLLLKLSLPKALSEGWKDETKGKFNDVTYRNVTNNTYVTIPVFPGDLLVRPGVFTACHGNVYIPELLISYRLFADSSPVREGSLMVKDVPVIEQRDKGAMWDHAISLPET